MAHNSSDLLLKEEKLIEQLRTILAFMSKSTFTKEQYNHTCQQMGLGCRLESIGKTCFGTLYWSSESLLQGLPAMRRILADDSLGIDIVVCVPEST